MTTRLVLLLGLVMGLCLEVGWAQTTDEISVSAEARPAEIGTAGTVTFEIEVRGTSLSAIETPEPPPTTNLVLQEATPLTQRKLSFDSGHLRRRITFVWRYQPMQVGIGRIQSTTLRINDDRYETQEVRVRIVPQSQYTPKAPNRASTQPSSSSSDPSSPSPLKPRDLFIRATASADTVYQNEQVTAEYRLFFRPGVRLRRSHMADAWDAPGFWREELDVDARPTPERTTLEGTTYKTIVLKRVALFPTRTGRLTVDPLRIETKARAQPKLHPDEPMVHSRYESLTLASDTLSVQVRPLPPDAPPTFDGAVGQFALDTRISTRRGTVGTAIDLTTHLEGRGNLSTLSPPHVQPPDAFDAYDPTVETTIDRSGTAVQGKKTFTFTFVPRTNGRHRLPPVQFSYFDPDAGRYETLRSTDAALQITGEAGPRAQSQAANGLPIGDLAGPMEPTTSYWKNGPRTPLYQNPWAYAAVAVPLLLAAGAVAYRRRRRPSPDVLPEDDSLDVAQTRLDTARRHRQSGNVQAFYETVERTVHTFLDRRLALPRAAARMTIDDLVAHLGRYDVPTAERDALRTLLDTCGQAQFTPATPSDADMANALEHTDTLLRRLDDALPHRDAPTDS